MKKVILIEPVLAHYRKDVFEMLSGTEEFKMEIVAGTEFQNILSLKDTKYTTFKHKYLKIINHEFYYMRGLLRFIRNRNPDAIVCTGVDFHQVHTIILFILNILFYHKHFFWWSHATTGNQGYMGVMIRKLIYRKATGVLAYSENGRRNLLSFGIPYENICVVNNSLNSDDYGFNHYDVIHKHRSDILKIVFCGRINESKKLPVLMQALHTLKQINDFKFNCTLVGDGDIEMLKQLVIRLDLLDEVSFAGGIYGKDLHPILMDSDIMVYPGGIGLSLAHALSFGIPVITTDNKLLHGPEIELLQEGQTGDYFKDNDAIDLADKLHAWHIKLHKSATQISAACMNSIKEHQYLPEKVASAAIQFIKGKMVNKETLV